jgi:23S rRNA (adenine2503-C2)-methyltransferase
VNTRWKVAEVLAAARHYADRTRRRVSVEYAMIRDVNDQPWRADLLGSLLHQELGPLVHVNVIPLNPTPGSRWDASPKAVEREFVRRVNAAGVPCTVRDTRGREIAAACGQLAAAAGEPTEAGGEPAAAGEPPAGQRPAPVNEPAAARP